MTETLQPSWVTSSATPIHFDLVSGEDETDNDFLNYRPASKSGYKYEDVDGSGTTGRREGRREVTIGMGDGDRRGPGDKGRRGG